MTFHQLESLCVTDLLGSSQHVDGGLSKATYGSLKRKAPLSTRSSPSTRTFFDSADYMMAKEVIMTDSAAKKDAAPDIPPPAAAATAVRVCTAVEDTVVADWRSLVEGQHGKADGSNIAGSSLATQPGSGLTGRDTQHNRMFPASPGLTASSPGSQPLYRGLTRNPSRLRNSSCCMP